MALKDEIRDKLVDAGFQPVPGKANEFTAPADFGHNSNSSPELPVDMPKAHRATDDRLRLLIERIERLEEEKKAIADDIRDVYAESKAVGYDTKIMREVIRLRKMDPDARAERDAVLETYLCALGMA